MSKYNIKINFLFTFIDYYSNCTKFLQKDFNFNIINYLFSYAQLCSVRSIEYSKKDTNKCILIINSGFLCLKEIHMMQ